MISETLSTICVSIFTTGVGGLFGWIFGRRKYNEEVKSHQVQNFDATIAAYKKMYDDMITDLRGQVISLKEENMELNKRLSDTTQQVMTLTNFVLASVINNPNVEISNTDVENLKTLIK